MPSEQRAAETDAGVTDRDLALVHAAQAKFCAVCHGTLSPNEAECDGAAQELDGLSGGRVVRTGRFMSIDVDIESDSDVDAPAAETPADMMDAADSAALCGVCRERAFESFLATPTRGVRYLVGRTPMLVDLETATPSPSPPPLVDPSPTPLLQECLSAVDTTPVKSRISITIPPSSRDTLPSSSPEAHSRSHRNRRKSASAVAAFPRHTSPVSTTPHDSRHVQYYDETPDPMVDITRLRVRSIGYKSLYPGASFRGTQKSGRNSYDVNVTVVDIDFASSFLCGYLQIRGLTDDWPELTTYFDAQIVGNRYGFLTQDWGATDKDDMIHWKRFATFMQVQDDIEEPRATLKDNKQYSAVFMRWKERFLVPDHRVQDINGASFAGFYYICVDFAPPKRSVRGSAQEMSQAIDEEIEESLNPYDEPVATMCGYYFHQNSEPYQQLSLTHVPDRFTSSFEFR